MAYSTAATKAERGKLKREGGKINLKDFGFGSREVVELNDKTSSFDLIEKQLDLKSNYLLCKQI